jgi:uncharacterized protein (TIGR02996 family)
MIDDERAFLAAIRAHPSDRTPRLVYADWLEDRGDPRAELVRVCEAMRRVPVFSGEYWRLKARRNQLRAGCPADWLAATGYNGSDYDPIFRDGVPDDWKGRWRLIREFTERWHGISLDDVGGRSDEVRSTEERLGLALPPALRERVAFLHDFRAFTLPLPGDDVDEVRPVDGLPALSIQRERFVLPMSKSAVVRLDMLDRPDPPVYQHGVLWTYLPTADTPAYCTTTAFAFSEVATTASPPGGRFRLWGEPVAPLLRRLGETIWVRAAFGSTEVYEAAQLVVIADPTPPGTKACVYARRPLPH